MVIFTERVVSFVMSTCCGQNEKAALIDVKRNYNSCKVEIVSLGCLETAGFMCQQRLVNSNNCAHSER